MTLPALRSKIRLRLLALRSAWLRHVWNMDIGRDCAISFTAKLDRTNPRGVHVGDYTGIAFGSAIISHDFLRNAHVDTWIGARCHIGAHVIVYPGVRIGDGCIIAAGSVVTRDIPGHCIAAGNPARIIEKDIVTGKWGIRIDTLPPERLDPKVLV